MTNRDGRYINWPIQTICIKAIYRRVIIGIASSVNRNSDRAHIVGFDERSQYSVSGVKCRLVQDYALTRIIEKSCTMQC